MEKLFIGKYAEIQKQISANDIKAFADISGDYNSLHLDEKAASNGPFKKIVAHGALSVALISSVIGTKLPGNGTIYLEQDAKFLKPVFQGDLLTVRVEIDRIIKMEKGIIKLITSVKKQNDELVLDGYAVVMVDPKRLSI